MVLATVSKRSNRYATRPCRLIYEEPKKLPDEVSLLDNSEVLHPLYPLLTCKFHMAERQHDKVVILDEVWEDMKMN